MKNTVYGLFQKTVKSNTDNIAIIENNRKITFGDLSEMVDMIADSFPKGIKSVGIVMRHRAEMIASIFAVLKTGAMYIPAEPSFPEGRIRYMMDEVKVDFILTEKQLAAKLKGYKQIYSDNYLQLMLVRTPSS